MLMKLCFVGTVAVVGIAGSIANSATIDMDGFGFKYDVGANDEDGPIQIIVDTSSSEVSNSVSGVIEDRDDEGNPVFYLQSAAIRGNLATGEIGLRTGTMAPVGVISGNSGVAEIQLFEALSFDLTGYAIGSEVEVTFATEVEGNVGGLRSLSGMNFNFGASSYLSLLEDRIATGGLASDSFSLGAFYLPGEYILDRSYGDVQSASQGMYEATLTLFGGYLNEVNLSVGMSAFGQTDFINTATLSVFSDAAYTSASGTFLTAVSPPPAVPLPASLPLLFIALGGMGIVGRSSKFQKNGSKVQPRQTRGKLSVLL